MSCTRHMLAGAAVGDSIFAIGGKASSAALSTVERFGLRSGSWSQAPPLAGERYEAAVAVLDSSIYVLGGWGGLDAVERLDLGAAAWKPVVPMRHGKVACGAAGLNGAVYVCGGWDGHSSLSLVERLDPEGRWSAAAPMARARAGLAVAALGGALYALGGDDGSSYLSVVERFDPREGAWKAVAPLETPRHKPAAAVLDGTLYALGGWDGASKAHGTPRLATVECFDPRGGTWLPSAPMREGREHPAAVVLDGALYAMGGFDGAAYLSSVERLNPHAVNPNSANRVAL